MTQQNILFVQKSKEALPYTCQLFQAISKEEAIVKLKAIGSAVLLTDGESYFLVSAAHVLDLGFIQSMCIPCDKGIWTYLKGQIHVTSVQSVGIRTGDNVDLAFMKLEPDVLTALKEAYDFLPISSLATAHMPTPGLDYAVCGFPASKTVTIQDKELKSVKSTGVLGRTRVNDKKIQAQDGFNECWNINFDYESESIKIDTGEKMDTPKASGISGGGVWFIDPKNSSSKIKLVGIATHCFPKPDEIISAIKIDIVVDSLMKMFGVKYTGQLSSQIRIENIKA